MFKNPIVYLDISVNQVKLGRILIELFNDITPKTSGLICDFFFSF